MGKIKKITENELVGGAQNTDIYPVTSVKAVYDENNERLDHILNRRGVINISTNYNADHIAEVLTLEQAIAKVPSKDRVLGFQGKFLSENGWKSYVFIGDSIADWTNKTKWNNYLTGTDVVQEPGDSEDKVVSQKALNDALNLKADQSFVNEALAKKADKENIAQEFGDSEDKVVSQSALPFRYIQSEEFIFAKVDGNDKLLFGIQWDGTPVFGKTSAVEDRLQSQVTLLAERVATIMGDEDTTNVIDTMNELKKFFAEIENTQTLTSILANLDKTTIKDEEGNVQDTPFRVIENEEFLAVEQDAEGKVLSSTNADGSHYIYNVKSETIPTEFSHIEDPEGMTEITTDAENKVLGYRDSEGTRHEHKISAKHIELSDEAAKEVNEAFKSAGIKMENPSDFSKDSHIELPIPRVAAQVRIYAPKLPTTKQDDIEAEIEYNDKDGNYFRKPVILNAQGQSSMLYFVKNMAIDINDGSEIKFGDFPTQDSFHLKKYYIDAFRGQCIVGYWLMEQVYKSRPVGQQYPYEYNYSNDSVTDGLGDVNKDFFTGAKCHPDGFPIIITWINTNTKEETWMGIYTWNLKKSKEVYFCNKKKAENIILDGSITLGTLFGGTINWSAFEIRNPKSLIDIDGNKYDGDNPKELSDTDANSKKVKDYIVRLSGVQQALLSSSTRRETFAEYFYINPFIDYYLVSQILFNFDGFNKNWIWVTFDGKKWCPTIYDVDSIFGQFWDGTHIWRGSDESIDPAQGNVLMMDTIYKTEIDARYKELRDNNIFSVNNIIALLNKWLQQVGYDNLKKELSLYNETPSYRDNNINNFQWSFVNASNRADNYDNNKTYNIGDTCVYGGLEFKANIKTQGVVPCKSYSKAPYNLGFHNSVARVKNWLNNRLIFTDKKFNYE